jgi:zinc transport system substrate-binding protein
MRRRVAAALLASLMGSTVGCGADGGGSTGVDMVAGFYPLAWAAERIGGDRVTVTDLTPAGTEPHDLELTTRQVDDVLDAEVVVVLGGGFQPAVEDAAARRDDATVDVLDELPQDALAQGDPHVWLDPVLMADLVSVIEAAFVSADPAHKARYRRNADDLRDELRSLDEAYRAGLATCQRDLVVTAHDAFGYLTDRYGLREEGVAGLSPDAEPDARRLAELADLARQEGVTTVFTEELLSPDIAETLAREAGGLRTEVLNPLESRSDQGDYLAVMQDNLDKIRAALGCS